MQLEIWTGNANQAELVANRPRSLTIRGQFRPASSVQVELGRDRR